MAHTAQPNAIVIGPAKLTEYLAKFRRNWNFFEAVRSVDEFTTGISNGSIDNDIHAIFMLDKSFAGPHAADFEELVATTAPYAMMCIVSYDPAARDGIRERVERQRDAMNVAPAPFFFISSKTPNNDISQAIDGFAREVTEDSRPAVESLVGPLEQEEEPEEAANPASLTTGLGQIKPGNKDALGRLIAMTSPKGGSGKSTVTLTTATYIAHASENAVAEGLAERPLKVVVLDLDTRDSQVGFFTGRMTPTVMNIRRDGVSKASIRAHSHHIEKLKLDVILGPRRPRAALDIEPEFFVELINELRQMYDFIFMDTSVNYLDPLLEKVAYPMADQIVAITDIPNVSIFSLTRWIQEVTNPIEKNGMGLPKSKIGLVVNKYIGKVLDKTMLEQNAQGVQILSIIPSNPRLVTHVTNNHNMNLLLQHDDMRPAIARIARAIVGTRAVLSERVT